MLRKQNRQSGYFRKPTQSVLHFTVVCLYSQSTRFDLETSATRRVVRHPYFSGDAGTRDGSELLGGDELNADPLSRAERTPSPAPSAAPSGITKTTSRARTVHPPRRIPTARATTTTRHLYFPFMLHLECRTFRKATPPERVRAFSAGSLRSPTGNLFADLAEEFVLAMLFREAFQQLLRV